jgi:hypothetical protein
MNDAREDAEDRGHSILTCRPSTPVASETAGNGVDAIDRKDRWLSGSQPTIP